MRVAIYCRLSEEDKNKLNPKQDSESIQNQKSMLVNYVIEQNWSIYNIYSDDDYAGSDRNRPEFNKLIEDAKQRKFDIILCKSQSRFTRELELVEKYIHGLFLELNIRFIGLADNADTSNEGNKKSRQINGLVNEWYLEDLSKNIKTVLRNKSQEGKHIGSFALYGYAKMDKNYLIIDENSALIVKKIYDLYLEGYGATKITNILNDEKIPNPSAYKRINGSNYKPSKKSITGDKWSYNTVTSILRNQMYAGDMVQHKIEKVSYKSLVQRRTAKEDWIIVENTHEAIIDRATFEKVQTIMDSKSKPFKAGKVHVLAGKVRCASCGKIMSTNNAKGVKYLRCQTGDVAKDICKGACIQLKKLEEVVLLEILELSNTYFDIDYIDKHTKLNDNREHKILQNTNKKNSLEKDVNEMHKIKQNSYVDKCKGVISEQMFISLNDNFDKEISTKELGISKIKDEITKLESEKVDVNAKIEIIEKYKDMTELSRDVVIEFIDKITIGKRENKEIPITIDWNI